MSSSRHKLIVIVAAARYRWRNYRPWIDDFYSYDYGDDDDASVATADETVV